MIQQAISQIVQGQALAEEEAQQVMSVIMEGQATPAQIGAFLAALRLKGETVAEITGFARAMRAKAVPMPVNHRLVVDTCGTGGDSKGTFNISTAAAIVTAACGVPVAKHGNRSVSSSCGSADVLEALGVNVLLTAEQATACLEEVGLTFLFAPSFHLAMKYAAAPRRELGIRTVFNLLGPLTNPAGARAQVLGVYDGRLTEVLALVLGRLGSEHVFVVHGEDGLDEATVTGPTTVSELHGGGVRTFALHPEDVGLARWPEEALQGGPAEDNARIILALLQGEKGARRDIVLLNAALALVAAGQAPGIEEGVVMAAAAVDSGAAMQVLERLVTFSRSCAA
ncbi:MAG: anthranilate phosphoribosyltransferase [Clostridia bacterium]|nr:MAG: anthranilate phosphoribosyltransferase [Clostridia bacterium]